jgi:hypothetical protein
MVSSPSSRILEGSEGVKDRDRKLSAAVGLLVLLAVTSIGVFAWAVAKSDTIATNAENTGGDGGTDQLLWLWVFLCPVVLAGLLVGLIMISSRRRRLR